MPNKLDTLPQVEVTGRAQWRAWLKKNHKQAEGIWLVLHKKHLAETHLPVEHAVEELLCFGWIDSTARPLDADRRMLYVCPRKPKSIWSRVNKARVERLIAAKRMTAAGLKVIEVAKANGSWSALDDVEALVVPADLGKALAKNKTAKKHFEAFPPSARKFILYHIGSARTVETRTKRIASTVALAAKNQRAHRP
ncbi:MAG: YdeI/OmpD-associated family protein [Flavobacteriales bacterium]|nr:YdeI/OmpD-associated family protein [Flavobacteriales bacterium]